MVLNNRSKLGVGSEALYGLMTQTRQVYLCKRRHERLNSPKGKNGRALDCSLACYLRRRATGRRDSRVPHTSGPYATGVCRAVVQPHSVVNGRLFLQVWIVACTGQHVEVVHVKGRRFSTSHFLLKSFATRWLDSGDASKLLLIDRFCTNKKDGIFF